MAKEQQLQGTKQGTKQGAKRMTPKQRAARKRRNIIIFVAELFVLAIVVGVAWFVIRGTSVKHPNVDPVGVSDTHDPNETLDLNPGQVNVNQNIYDQVTEPENPMARYMQIALFGVDSRNKKLGSSPTRSDTNIIACIDTEKKEIRLVSVYRDTYLNLTNGSYNKCNGAYFAGGPTRAMTMLNMNLDLAITDYVTVGFWGLIDLIDALGGVWIDVTEAEIHYLNDYQISMVGTTTDGKHYTANEGDYIPVKTAGYQRLNGLQAVAYCRIRYIGNDYGRTERQRKVIASMMDVAKDMSLTDLTKIANSNIFNEFETSIKLDVILSMLGDIGEYKIVESCGFPDMNMLRSGTIGAKGDCVVPLDLEQNVSKLHQILFGTEDYVPTATVKEYSAEIKRQTQAYFQ